MLQHNGAEGVLIRVRPISTALSFASPTFVDGGCCVCFEWGRKGPILWVRARGQCHC